MKKLLLFIKKNLTPLIALTIPLALLIGYNFNMKFLKVSTSWILFLMVYPMMINLNIKDVINVIKNPKPVAISLLLNFTIVPLIAFAIGKTFFAGNPMLIVGMVLIGLIPTSGMTASWTGLAGGKVQTALVMMATNLLVSIVMIPIYMKLLLGQVVDTPTLTIIYSLIKVILVPMILGTITRKVIVKLSSEANLKALKPVFGGISSVGVIAIVFVAISLKSPTILANVGLVGNILIPVILFYGSVLLISQLATKLLSDSADKIPFIYGITLRNLTIALGISLSSFGESLAVLLIALSYIVQLPIASLYMKFTQKQAT